MAKTYEINVICRNCGHIPVYLSTTGVDNHNDESVPIKFPIPKGITVKWFLIDMTCENCGCGGYMGLLNQPG